VGIGFRTRSCSTGGDRSREFSGYHPEFLPDLILRARPEKIN
jgi:hypothetical protein